MANTPLGFPFGFYNNDNTPLDGKYYNRATLTKYASVAECNASIPVGARYEELTVDIAGVEYWYHPTTTDTDLVVKTGGGLSTTLVGTLAKYTAGHYATDYTKLGSSATVTDTGGLLAVSSGAGYTDYIKHSGPSSLHDFYTFIRLKNVADGAGISVGTNSAGEGIVATLVLTGGSKGQVKVVEPTGAVDLATSGASLLSFVNSDEILLLLVVSGFTVTAHAINLTTQQSIVSAQWYAGGTPLVPSVVRRIGNPSIFMLGGSQQVLEHSFFCTMKREPAILFVGDSLTVGLTISSATETFVGKLKRKVKEDVYMDACGGNTTTDINSCLSEILSIAPTYVLVMMGTNDAFNGVLLATFLASFDTFITTLIRAKITPIIIEIPPFGSSHSAAQTLATSYNAGLHTAYDGRFRFVAINASLTSAGFLAALYNSGDDIHLNDVGDLVIDDAVTLVMKDLVTIPGEPKNLLQGGNKFNQTLVAGTIDLFDLRLKTSDVTAAIIKNNGSVLLGRNSINYTGTENLGVGVQPSLVVTNAAAVSLLDIKGAVSLAVDGSTMQPFILQPPAITPNGHTFSKDAVAIIYGDTYNSLLRLLMVGDRYGIKFDGTLGSVTDAALKMSLSGAAHIIDASIGTGSVVTVNSSITADWQAILLGRGAGSANGSKTSFNFYHNGAAGSNSTNCNSIYLTSGNTAWSWDTSVAGVITEGMRLIGQLLGVGVTVPTAHVHAKAADAQNASLCVPAGSRPTTPVDGDIWNDGTHLVWRNGGTDINLDTTGGGGAVTAVTGTTNRIASSGGATPAIDIDSSYVGQTSITTLGTIGTGNWQGTAIGDIYISSATNWNTAYTNRITALTVTGSSGASTLSSNTLNIPTYTLAGLGGTTLSAVNAQNLSAFAATTSAQLAGVISDETGSGALVFGTSPTLATPTLGVATATSINKVTLTAPATSATLAIADGKTFTSSNTLTLTGTDGSSVAFGPGGTVVMQNAFTAITDVTTTSQTISLDGGSLQGPLFKHSVNNDFTYSFVASSFKDGAIFEIAATKATASNITVTLSTTNYTHFNLIGGASITTLPAMTQANGNVGYFSGLVKGTTIYWTSTESSLTASPVFTGTVTLPTQTNTVGALLLPVGPLLSSAASGYIENDGTSLYYTTSTPTRKIIATRSDKLSVFAATTSAELAATISDETGTGLLVFSVAPTFTGAITAATATFSGAISSVSPTFTGTVTMPATTTIDSNGLGVGGPPSATKMVSFTKTFTSNTLTSNLGMGMTSNIAPTATVGTGYIGYGAIISTSITTAQNVYCTVGVLTIVNNSNVATTTVGIGSMSYSAAASASNTATISSSVGNYSYCTNIGAGNAVFTSSYSYYGGISKKVGAGTLTGTSSYVFYSEAADAANSNDLRTGTNYNIGTFTNNFSFYSAGGNNALLGSLAIGLAANTAASSRLHLPAGTATANTAPLQINAGTNETTIRSGLVEFNNAFFVSNSALNRVGLGGKIVTAFADTGNTTTTETDLHTYTTKANTLLLNGADLESEYGGIFVSSATATRQLRLYFGGTVIFDSGALTISLAASWTVYATVMRVSATVVRYMISMATEGAALAAYTAVGELTGLTLSNTNVLKITGQAASTGAATNDIVLKQAKVSWNPAVDN